MKDLRLYKSVLGGSSVLLCAQPLLPSQKKGNGDEVSVGFMSDNGEILLE